MRYYVPSRHADLLHSLIQPVSREEAQQGGMHFQFRGAGGHYVPKDPNNPNWKNILGMFNQLGYGPNYGDVPRVQEAIEEIMAGTNPTDVVSRLLEEMS